MNPNQTTYRDHLAQLDGWLDDALTRARKAEVEVDAVLFHAGRDIYYHADDHPVVFWPTPHFRRWVPSMGGTEHVVLARPGTTPIAVRVRPRDYWFDVSEPPRSYWEDSVDLREVESFSAVADALGSLDRVAFVGGSAAAAAELGVPDELVEPSALIAPLDWYRAYKTPHELALVRRACEKGAGGHAAARDAFFAGGSERDLHRAFLGGSDQVGPEVPFGTIMAFDEKGSILHYENKRPAGASPGRSVVVDAGATFEGYASDITRTWTRDDADPTFVALVEGVDQIERELVEMVRPGLAYEEIHLTAHRRLAEILCEQAVLTGSVDEAMEVGLMRAFMPHGVGHHLGIQVHDVGGRQATPDGGTLDPPAGHPWLRTTRPMEPGHLVTIEPGLYFIDMLLEPFREGEHSGLVDWAAVDRLSVHGGIRIEDDVVCTGDGFEDLTRPLLPGPRGV